MVDNITAYNLRLAKVKRRCEKKLRHYNQAMTKRDITEWANGLLRGKLNQSIQTKLLRVAKEGVKQAIRNAGEKVCYVKNSDLIEAAREVARKDLYI